MPKINTIFLKNGISDTPNMKTLNHPLNDTNHPVKCLGISFENEQARRAYFLEQLREKLQDIDFKSISGIPQATDEAILALSDPPYYTACPNPWIIDFLKNGEGTQKDKNDKNDYHREPFATDITEGKNDPIYKAHSYHTKVPHKAIMHYILHYTEPGDVVFDGFCGTGMTGVAAQLCGNKKAVEALGYRVQPDGTIEAREEKSQSVWQGFSKLGARRAILNDLSPAATFIAHNYNTPVDVIAFEQETQEILQTVEAECGWMYQTLHLSAKNIEKYANDIKSAILGEMDCPPWLIFGRINYTVWSDVFICPECANDIVFWEVAIDKVAGKVKPQFPCPHCDASLTKRTLERAWITRFDSTINETIRQAKQIPVLINYSVDKTRYKKTPDAFDLTLLDKIENAVIPYWFPMLALPDGYNTRQPKKSHGFNYLHHFYTKRNLWILAHFRKACQRQHLLLFQSIVSTLSSRLVRYNLGKRGNGILPGTLYVSSLTAESNCCQLFAHKIRDFMGAFCAHDHSLVLTQSLNNTGIPSNSLDYLFLDPPFGSNLMYSELNFFWEAWLQVFTNIQPEAIVNKIQGKQLSDYRALIVNCFKEAFRILKPGRWMTVEFSNTQARVWNTLQTTLQEAGFIIANVSALDKKQGSFKAVTTTTAVKQDLIISAYKPNDGLEERFKKAAGSEAGVWEFVRSHLNYLPITKTKGGELELIAERDPRILYDRTVAYFIGHGYPVPLSSQQFQAGLREHFKERDGMMFRLDQIEGYEQKRKVAKQPPQMELFVSDERSAIDWLQHFLKKRPSTRQDIHPELTKLMAGGWKKYELIVELDALLEFNFLKYEGKGAVPSQIHAYLSHQFKKCRNLEKDDPVLQQYATKRWYVPDPHKAQDLEKIREAHLLREFKQYRQNTNKRLKTFRLEAMRAGFKHAWGQQDYEMIIEMSKKIPEAALYEDEKLLQLYDLAIVRLEVAS